MGLPDAPAAGNRSASGGSGEAGSGRLVNLLPRRMHWSVNVRSDTRQRYRSANPYEIAKRVGHRG